MKRTWEIFVEIRRIMAIKLLRLWIARQKRTGRIPKDARIDLPFK